MGCGLPMLIRRFLGLRMGMLYDLVQDRIGDPHLALACFKFRIDWRRPAPPLQGEDSDYIETERIWLRVDHSVIYKRISEEPLEKEFRSLAYEPLDIDWTCGRHEPV